MDKRIIVIGSSNTDMIIKVPYIPRPGETILGGSFSTAPGGKGANQAVAAARAGGSVTFLARVGNDMFGQESREGFVKDNINVDSVLIDNNEPSGVALIFVAEDGENSIAVAGGANTRLSPSDVLEERNTISSGDMVVMQLETPLETVKQAASIASGNHVPVILDPAPAQLLDENFLKHIHFLTPNESEAALLTGIKVVDEETAGQAAEILLEKGVDTVVLTMGSRGAFIASKDIREMIPACKVKPVDTTAAGDVFNGALAVALTENKPLKDAVCFANAAAALSVTKLGAQPSAPTREKIDQFIENL
jgi:ribokinase